MLSTGMSTADEIDDAVSAAGRDRLLLAHSTSRTAFRAAS
jgi:hypothetical protein